MDADDLPAEATLDDVLRARALRTPADRLAIDIVGGVLVAFVACWARPAGWLALFAAALCLAAYGVWAVSERRLQRVSWTETIAREPIWRAVNAIAAVLGLAAFATLVLVVLGIVLGRVVS